MDDTQVQCPTFNSTELLEDGSRQDVTLITYQRHKHDLYEVMSDIIEIFYHQRSTKILEIIQQAKSIESRLSTWLSGLPPELRLTSFKPGPSESDVPETLRIFRVQSLALQILYYNAQIMLYRPFLTPRQKGPDHRFRPHGIPSVVGDTVVEAVDLAFYQTCRSECFAAAIRTASLIEFQDILRWSGRTPVAPFIGMHSFTAGSVLCLFAVACPLTATAQKSKKGLGNLIKMLRIMNSPTKLCEQSAGFAKDFLQLVLSEEMRVLTSENLPDLGDDTGGCRASSSANINQSESLDILGRSTSRAGPHANSDETSIPGLTAGQDSTEVDRLMFDSQVPFPLDYDPSQRIDAFEDAVTALQSGELSL